MSGTIIVLPYLAAGGRLIQKKFKANLNPNNRYIHKGIPNHLLIQQYKLSQEFSTGTSWRNNTDCQSQEEEGKGRVESRAVPLIGAQV